MLMVSLVNQQETSLDRAQWLNAGTPEVNHYMTIVQYFCNMQYEVCFENIEYIEILSFHATFLLARSSTEDHVWNHKTFIFYV